jgi:hypothetical protein
VFDRVLNQDAHSDVWVINADGTDPHAITNTPSADEIEPDWGTFQ